MFSQTPFYFSTVSNLLVAFGTIFNNISLTRKVKNIENYFSAGDVNTVDVDEDLFTIPNHRLETGDRVRYNTNGGTVIPGLTNNQLYYVIKKNNNSFQLAISLEDVEDDIPIELTGLGLGVKHEFITSNLEDQVVKVPIAYGPKEKSISLMDEKESRRRGGDSDVKYLAPRMAFEIVDIRYDRERKTQNIRNVAGSSGFTQLSPVPYVVELKLSILVKYHEDGLNILEQIFPYFRPNYTVTLNDVVGMGIKRDVPISILGVTSDSIDSYEGSPDIDRLIVWELSFQANISFYPPINKNTAGLIKKVITNLYDLESEQLMETVTVEVVPETAGIDDDYEIVTTITNTQ